MSDIKSPWLQETIVRHSLRLWCSFHYWTDKYLLEPEVYDGLSDPATIEKLAKDLFEAPFVLVSHGMEVDPIFNYGNQTALNLWQLTWEQFILTPSRRTVEPVQQEERQQLLAQAETQGVIRNYRGVRISSSGRRFYIEDVTLWNVLDEQKAKCGQAATFTSWQWID